MSLLEWITFFVNVLCVYLTVIEKDVNWPIGFLGSIGLAIITWQYKYYAQFALMIFYILECVYGWWMWTRKDKSTGLKLIRIGKTKSQTAWLLLIIGIISQAVLAPVFYLTADPAPFWDCAILIASIIAEYMLCVKLYESWALYFLADIASIILFASIGAPITAATYVVFALLCLAGIFAWRRSLKPSTPALSLASSIP